MKGLNWDIVKVDILFPIEYKKLKMVGKYLACLINVFYKSQNSSQLSNVQHLSEDYSLLFIFRRKLYFII